MQDFERVPYDYPSDDDVLRFAGEFLEMVLPLNQSYSLQQAMIDAFSHVNIRNAVTSGFIDGPIHHITPGGILEFTIHAVNRDVS